MKHSRLFWIFMVLVGLAGLAAVGASCDDDDDDDDNDDDADDDSGDDDDDTAGDDDTVDDDDDDDDTASDDDTGDDDTGIECDHDANYRNEGAKVHMIDLAQGEAIYVQTEQDYNILINGGPADPTNLVINYLLDEGVVKLQELVLASILDEDIGEVPDIVAQFEIDLVRKSPAESDSVAYLAAMTAIEGQSITVQINQAGDTINWLGDPELVLGPITPFPEKYSDRDKGLVIRFSVGRIDFMLAGSITSAAEEDIIDLFGANVCSEALKVSYHGASDTCSETFLSGVDPGTAVIVAGWNNPQGFPHQAAVDRLNQQAIPFGVTFENGNMVWESNGWDVWFCEG